MTPDSATSNPHTGLWPEGDRPASEGRAPTRLHLAVLDGDETAVRSMLAAGENPNAVSFFGLTPLHLCVRRYAHRRTLFKETAREERICEQLLAAGANPRARDFQGAMPAAWGEGFAPGALRNVMLAYAESGAWQEDFEIAEGRNRRVGSGHGRLVARVAA
ncbi:MAG: ankyrin repeat domain-containing protein [Rudaea sp.]|uniref:ankyrin repeat domain-containing protein n=1 Tax=unclassified Rudaea TaxID=2627037 RepID=UPI0010F51CC0|nr:MULTISPECIES: ankyrin repeat domain-containing protein [unclassified Rudaea]MBN8884463.1 ankyrin repeat domain-containing protein [Rudaea sp.]